MKGKNMVKNVKDAEGLLRFVADEEIVYVDFRFTDYKAKWHHISYHRSALDEDVLEDGLLFDGSSIDGWCTVNESDMKLKPDYATVGIDPFAAQKTAFVVCTIVDPLTDQPYPRDPRSVAKKAEAYLASTGIADTVFVGAPVWWYTVATPVLSYLKKTDFLGKKVVPFSTQGSNAGTFFADFAAKARNAVLLKGEQFNNLSDKYAKETDNKIAVWLNSL